jgi:hypothetical protein
MRKTLPKSAISTIFKSRFLPQFALRSDQTLMRLHEISMTRTRRKPLPPTWARMSAALLVAIFIPAAPVAASSIANAFTHRPADIRIAIQKQLAQAELFVGVIDGTWGGATERALLRGADKVADVSNGKIQPDLRSPRELDRFLDDIAAGIYNELLRPTSRVKGGWFGLD